MSTHNICFCAEIRKILSGYPSYLDISLDPEQGPIVQSIVSLTSSLMTNLLTVVAKAFSNTLGPVVQSVVSLVSSLRVVS